LTNDTLQYIRGVKKEIELISVIKYGNRKLYNITEKNYTSLKELFYLIRKGKSIQVTEHSTKEDITYECLKMMAFTYSKIPKAELLKIIKNGEENEFAK
jgi:polyhydroxyalkanoate synthesis regulator protein